MRGWTFFQGLIQLAIGYYHLTTGNPTGAQHLLERGVEKLNAFLPGTRGVLLSGILATSDAALRAIQDGKMPLNGVRPKIEREGDAG